MSIININKNFNTQNRCVKYLESLRWADGLYCIHCGTDKSITKRKKSTLYHCNNCMINAEPVKEPTKIFYKPKKRKKDESRRTKTN